MKARVYLSVFLLTMAMAITVGCAKGPNDAQIQNDVQSKFGMDSGLQGKQLGVQSASGVVTLSGNVDNDIQRDAAARFASKPGPYNLTALRGTLSARIGGQQISSTFSGSR